MSREITISGIFIHANATRCFHVCRYCQLHNPKPVAAQFSRYAALVERFIDWKASTAQHAFAISEWYGNSHDYDLEARVGIRRLSERQGDPLRVVLLGGVTHRSMADMRVWLHARQEVGIDTVVASFPGHGDRHDYWNNKKGNYAFHLDTLRLAAEMGMRLQQRLFLIRDTVTAMPRLLEDLDSIHACTFERWSFPLFYSGFARHLERERLTRHELDCLPAFIRATFRSDHNQWRSERQWIEFVRAGQAERVERVPLVLNLDAASLAWAEVRSCDQIVAELTEQAKAAYEALPSRQELCDRYGDLHNERVYMFLGQMERVWLDRYGRDHPGELRLVGTAFH